MAQYRSSFLIIVWLTVLGLYPCPSRATVQSSQKQGAIALYSQTERSLKGLAGPKVIANSSMALELAQANDSKATEEKEKKKEKKADSGVPKPVRVVLGLLRGRKTLLALSVMSVLITGMAVFILLKLFDDSQPEDEEGNFSQEQENLEGSEDGSDPELEEQDRYFESTEPVFQTEVEFPNAPYAGVEVVNNFVQPDKSLTPPPPKISPLTAVEFVETREGVSEEKGRPSYWKETKDLSEQDNNGTVPTVLQPPRDTEIDTKFQDEDSYTGNPWETSTPRIESELADRSYQRATNYPQDEIKDTVRGVSQSGDREPIDRNRGDIELSKEAPPAPPVNVVEELIEQLQNTNAESRQNAIWQLGEKGDSRAIEPLVNLLRDSDSKQQSMILASLSQIGNKTLKPMVRALSLSLQNENKEVRINAIRDLTDVYDVVVSVSNILQYAVEDPDDKVRETARWALEKLNRIRPPRNLDL